MTKRKDASLLSEREKRLLGYIKEGLPAAEIGRREGLQADYALKLRNEIAAKHGVVVKKTKSPHVPYGLDDESRVLRKRLGDKLYNLLQTRKLSQLEVARSIGVPRKLQIRAIETPYVYNWTLGEIQQLAKAHGVPFKDFVRELLEENRNGTD